MLSRRLIFLVIFVFVLCFSATGSQKCPLGEEYVDCIESLCRDVNCSQTIDYSYLKADDDCCTSGCICSEGTLRSKNGTCVPENQCDEVKECGQNERLNSCPNGCDVTSCPESFEKEQEYKRNCVAPAVCLPPQCQCIPNYRRDQNGTCIPIEDCPNICRANEVFSKCTQILCRGQNCSDLARPIPCPSIQEGSCIQGCVCAVSFLRDKNGCCIPQNQCPNPCGENERLNECPNGCDVTDCPESYEKELEYKRNCVAPAVCLPPQCQCIPNYRRNENGTCVPIQDCPNICGINEEFSTCAQSLCRAQNCTQLGQSIPCPRVIPEFCEKKCVCVEGTLRNDKGFCVPEDQCSNNLSCSDNESINSCPGNCNDFCPTSETDKRTSCFGESGQPGTAECGEPICACRFNYRRDNENGTCIPTRDCTPFDCSIRPNEKYDPCPPLCPTDDCSQATPTGRCPLPGRIGIVVQCNPTCRCIDGFWRNNGICVPYAECPNIRKCPINEEFTNCTQRICRIQDCSQKGQFILCADVPDESCQAGCVCVDGTVRNENGTCVAEDQCPVKQCGENEQLNECPNGCDVTACPECLKKEQEYKQNCVAAAVCLSPECQCIPNYRRDQNGTCIPIENCPGICPSGEELSTCAQAICRAQNCTQLYQPIACPAIAEGFCELGCVCPEGSLRNEYGVCIPENQCPNACGQNERLNECPNGCDVTNCPENYEQELKYKRNCVTPAVCLPPQCQCIPNYRRNENGTCIPIDMCPNICGTNENFSYCKEGLCVAQNCSELGKPMPCPRINTAYCTEGCVCAEGFVRNENGCCIPQDQCPSPCGENEFLNQCPGGCAVTNCPESFEKEQEYRRDCVSAAVCLSPRCQCLPNYRKNEKGVCIPIENCPGICPQNEILSNCVEQESRALNCSQKGQTLNSESSNSICTQGCICAPGYLRNEQGICIEENLCQEICPKNEMFSECAQTECTRQECPEDSPNCEAEVQCICTPGCACISGTYRDETGTCVPTTQCGELLACGPNEMVACVQDCPPEKTCRNRGIFFNCLESNEKCQQKCICKEGLFRNAVGECITNDQCDQCLGKHEYFTCGGECDNICETLSVENKTNCLSLNIQCNKKCYCEDGFARPTKGSKDCVPIDQCPKKTCGPNEEYSCKNKCQSNLCSSIVSRIRCDGNDNTCYSNCYCKDGFYRQREGAPCVPLCECDEMKNSPDCMKQVNY